MTAECNALAGAASDGSVVGSHAVTYRLSSRPMRATACCDKCVGQCLSRMRGNSPVRFLGERAVETPLSYPTEACIAVQKMAITEAHRLPDGASRSQPPHGLCDPHSRRSYAIRGD